jgi:hypothetical protein
LSPDVSEIRAASIIRAMIDLMMEAARTSETSVDNYSTRQYIPEDKSELQLSFMMTVIFSSLDSFDYLLSDLEVTSPLTT